jgi:hypothetical protein
VCVCVCVCGYVCVCVCVCGSDYSSYNRCVGAIARATVVAPVVVEVAGLPNDNYCACLAMHCPNASRRT